MNSSINDRLRTLRLELLVPNEPGANYIQSARVGSQLILVVDELAKGRAVSAAWMLEWNHGTA